MEIDKTTKKILDRVGISFIDKEILIDREALLNFSIYHELKQEIDQLRKVFSSSSLTSLHKEANAKQKWPLLNLIRQILRVYGYKMEPIRKCDGYTADGMKKFKRFFLIQKIPSLNA
uniref:Uncharacterized protein n=1 Tax=viral metagenome TaxID=1070528 RepID=A0A6C0BAU3_9ZZZZ